MNFIIKKYKDYKDKLKLVEQKKIISQWLDIRGVKNYTINDNLIIDVDGSVNLSAATGRPMRKWGAATIKKDFQIDNILYQFGNVSGDFDCSYNKLVSFKGCPKYVGGKFDASNNQINTFEFFPKFVGSQISLHYNNLNSLKFFPHDFLNETNSSIYFSYNKIYDLRYMPYKFFSRIYFHKNPFYRLIMPF